MKPFTLLVGIAAVAVAGCAAFFSVTGLALLFSGASLAVAIMGTSLEIAKLVSASYLHTYWEETNKFLRTYLLIGVIILVIITSAGIFGFLSNAYQSTSLKSDVVSREIEVYTNKITSNQAQITQFTSQISNLQQNSGSLLGNGKVNNRLIRSIDTRDKQISKINDKMSLLQDSISVWNIKINQIKNNNLDLEREIGGFKFIAEAFELEINSVVKFFIFLLIFVFDPLAVTLIIAFNTALTNDRKKKVVNSVRSDKKWKIYGEDTTNTLNNSVEDIFDEQLLKDFDDIDYLVENNYQNTEDSGKNLSIKEKSDIIVENINYFEDTEESVSITPKKPYYMFDDFNWNDKNLWINDRNAIKFWMNHKNGNKDDLEKIKEDFTQKSY